MIREMPTQDSTAQGRINRPKANTLLFSSHKNVKGIRICHVAVHGNVMCNTATFRVNSLPLVPNEIFFFQLQELIKSKQKKNAVKSTGTVLGIQYYFRRRRRSWEQANQVKGKTGRMFCTLLVKNRVTEVPSQISQSSNWWHCKRFDELRNCNCLGKQVVDGDIYVIPVHPDKGS